MDIFFPFRNNEYHPFLEEIQKYSNCQFFRGDLKMIDSSVKVINIHWPETIFGWQEPSINELVELETKLKSLKKATSIIYTKHDFERTKGTSVNFSKLFQIIEENTDIFIHLGNYSKKFYQKKYPLAKHEIVVHPIFENSYHLFEKAEARRILGIDEKSVVIIAPGQIRNLKERNLVINSFKGLQINNKVLISTNMRTELQFDFPGRVRMRKFFDAQNYFKTKFRKKYRAPRYFFHYSPLSEEDLSVHMSAADVVLVPRTNLLNSGIVFLGLTFGKVTVGPAIGNIHEQLKEHHFPVFDPSSISSVINALEEGIELSKRKSRVMPLDKHKPFNVAKEYDKIIYNVINK